MARLGWMHMGGMMTQNVARFGSPEFPINKGFGVIYFGHQARRKRKGVRERKRRQKRKNLPKNEEERHCQEIRATIVKHAKRHQNYDVSSISFYNPIEGEERSA